MLDKERQYSRAGALMIAILFSLAGPRALLAQTGSPFAGSFDELFPKQGRGAPVFTRPDII